MDFSLTIRFETKEELAEYIAKGGSNADAPSKKVKTEKSETAATEEKPKGPSVESVVKLAKAKTAEVGKDAVKAVMKKYGTAVSEIPAAKLGKFYAELKALEKPEETEEEDEDDEE